MNDQLTPDDVIKVAKQILQTQRERGHKPGWAYYEMERRTKKVKNRLSWWVPSAGGVAADFGMRVMEIAKGGQTVEEFREELVSFWS